MLPLLAAVLFLKGTAPVSATVVRVVDGDTIIAHVEAGDVRVLGLDCPEASRNIVCRRKGTAACEAELPKGRAATAKARELLDLGAEIRLEPGRGSFRRDRWARTVAADVMIASGLCHAT